jgi:TolA-binding protein
MDDQIRKDAREGFGKRKIIITVICAAVIVAILHFSADEKWKEWFRGHSGDTFHEGRWLVTQGQYRQAILILSEYLDKNPKGQNASRSIFFIGKAYMGLGEMDLARQAFDDTYRDFPKSLEAHKALYKLAMIDLLEGSVDQAIQGFASLAQMPNGPLAPEAAAMYAYLTHQR